MHFHKLYFYIPALLTAVLVFFVPYHQKQNTDVYASDTKDTFSLFQKKCKEEVYLSATTSVNSIEMYYESIIPSTKNGHGALLEKYTHNYHTFASTFNDLATEDETIVVFIEEGDSFQHSALTTSWYGVKTMYGNIPVACDAVSLLENEKYVTIEDFSEDKFFLEVAPFIKRSIPRASILRVRIKQNLTESQISEVADMLSRVVGDNSIVVGSFGSVATISATLAKFHAVKNISDIATFSYDEISGSNFLATSSLFLTTEYMKKNGALEYRPLDISKENIVTEITKNRYSGYSGGVFYKSSQSKDLPLTVLSFGDMMLDRLVRRKINENNFMYPFEKITSFIQGSDVVVVNAEGPFTDFPSKTVSNPKGPLTFTFDPHILPTLKDLGFTILGNANNHTLNFGRQGLSQSEKYIQKNGLSYFGDPSNTNPKSYTETRKGKKITYIGYHQFANGGMQVIINDIREAKALGSFVVVYPHWGEEYKEMSMTKLQVKIAHDFIDAGADVIIGSHPHVIEPIEIYKNKVILYSLGNFIFDQANTGPTSKGLALGFSLEDTKITYYLFPFTIKHAQAEIMSNSDSSTMLDTLADASIAQDNIKSQIRKGVFVMPR